VLPRCDLRSAFLRLHRACEGCTCEAQGGPLDTGRAAYSNAQQPPQQKRSARLDRARPLVPSRPGEFHPEPLTDPDVILSHHPARATARRLPPSVDEGLFPASRLARSTAMTCPLRSSPITEPSALLRGSPPLSGALVLSALRLTPLAPFPLASPARFSRSVPEPGRASRRLYAGCRSVSIRSSSELIPEEG
jgi:hypothetical protein